MRCGFLKVSDIVFVGALTGHDAAVPEETSASGVAMHRFVSLFVLTVATVPPLELPRSDAAEKFDVILRGGRIVDGTGAPWYIGDIGIRDGKIARFGRLKEAQAAQVMDASGLIVTPGFIDMMGQTATPMLEASQAAMNLLTQGVTTINAGEGRSAAPLDADGERRYGWKSFAGYFQLIDLRGLPINVAQTVGHTQIRRHIIGEVDRRPTDEELKKMQELVRQAMRDGAIGVSTALIYPPAVYAQTEEIAALASGDRGILPKEPGYPLLAGVSPSGLSTGEDAIQVTLVKRVDAIADTSLTVNGETLDVDVSVEGNTTTLTATSNPSKIGINSATVSYNGREHAWTYFNYGEPLTDGGKNLIASWDFES